MKMNLRNGGIYGYALAGRFGLGHSLLAWARCFLWCRDDDVPMLAPRWFYFRLGPYLRHEMDKRSYHKLFRKDAYVHGIRRFWILRTAEQFSTEQQLRERKGAGTGVLVFENDVLDNTRFFKTIFGRHAEVRSELVRIASPTHLPTAQVSEPFIGIHVRMGDFTRVADPSVLSTANNVQLPIEWYREVLLSIRKVGYKIPARLFSDGGKEALRPLLDLPNVSLITPFSALHDIFELSRASIMVSSGSGFSMWASYLGQVPRICFPNQRRERVVASTQLLDPEPECETGRDIPDTFLTHVESSLNRVKSICLV